MMKPPDLIDYWVFEDGKADVEGFQLAYRSRGWPGGVDVWTSTRRREEAGPFT
jgi:hypothetical protein